MGERPPDCPPAPRAVTGQRGPPPHTVPRGPSVIAIGLVAGLSLSLATGCEGLEGTTGEREHLWV